MVQLLQTTGLLTFTDYLTLCRAVQCQQFGVALGLLQAGADPLHRSKHDGVLSTTPLTAVMDSIPAGSCSTSALHLLADLCTVYHHVYVVHATISVNQTWSGNCIYSNYSHNACSTCKVCCRLLSTYAVLLAIV